MKFPVRMVGKHGAMHAYNMTELANLQSLGWAVEEPDPPVRSDGDDHIRGLKKVLEATFPNIATEPPKRKPGRPRKAE